jgi:PBP1b-binding outer membrane lipoprotein LpoB
MITLKNIITVSTLSLMLFASCSSTATKEVQNSSNEMKIEEMKKETYVLVHSAWLGA